MNGNRIEWFCREFICEVIAETKIPPDRVDRAGETMEVLISGANPDKRRRDFSLLIVLLFEEKPRPTTAGLPLL